MRDARETFGISGPDLAAASHVDQLGGPSPIATTRAAAQPPANPLKALIDPQGSAIFWVGLAAVLGLFMVAAKGHVENKISLGFGGRAGR